MFHGLEGPAPKQRNCAVAFCMPAQFQALASEVSNVFYAMDKARVLRVCCHQFEVSVLGVLAEPGLAQWDLVSGRLCFPTTTWVIANDNSMCAVVLLHLLWLCIFMESGVTTIRGCLPQSIAGHSYLKRPWCCLRDWPMLHAV